MSHKTSRIKAVEVPANLDPFDDDYTESAAQETTLRELADLQALDLAEIVATEPPETPWLIGGWLAHGDRVVLAGKPKAGKSCVLFDLALSLALGVPWLDSIAVERPQRVIYIDEEQGTILARQRIHRAMTDRGLSPSEIADASERILYLSRNRLNLSQDANNTKLLQDAIRLHRADWVLVDTLKRLHSCDENSAESVSAFLDGILDGALLDAGCVLLAHMRKGMVGEDDVLDALRGSSDFGAWFDSVWGYVLEGTRRKLVMAVSRWDETASPVYVDKDGGKLTCVSAQGQAEDSIIRLLDFAGSDGALRQDILAAISEELGLDGETARKAVSRSLGRLFKNGDVSKERTGKETRYWHRSHAPVTAENAVTP